MKRVNKLLSATLAGVLTLSAGAALASCGGKEDPNLKDASVLNITMPDLGYGTAWMKAVGDGFTKKTGTKVNINVTPNEAGYGTAMRAGNAPYDIYVMREQTYGLVASNAANVSGYECILASYDNIYNSQVANETKEDGSPLLFKEKMKDTFEIYNRTDAKGNGDMHYYAVQWCDSVFALVRNLDVWEEDWEVPVTTDELIALADEIKADGKTPFIWSSQASYWWAGANIWITQYQGLDDMYGEQGFWKGYDEYGNKNVPEMWMREGILHGLTVLEQLLKPENKYQNALSTSVDFTTAQGYFMIPKNEIAMMVNGDWLYNEMVKNYSTSKIDMFNMPVVSAIRNHPACEGTIESDAELSALIKAIDAGSTALSGTGYEVSQSAYNKVAEARNLYTCGSNMNHIMVTPVNTDSMPLVEAFYNYLASEEGLAKFAGGSGGFTLCFDTSDEVRAASDAVANSFVKSTEKIKQGKQVAPWPVYESRLFAVGGMNVVPMIELGYQFPELIFSLEGKGYKTALQIWQQNYDNAVTKWNTFMQTAGLQQ